MKDVIPFLRPAVVRKEAYLGYLDQIDASHIYSNYGPLNRSFERRAIEECFSGSGFCVTVNNATTGLMLAIKSLARPGGRYAVMPSFTFAATPLAAEWAGLEPYFVDVDARTWATDEACLSGLLERLGDDVGVVVPYATFGQNLDLAYFGDLHRRGLPVVLDAAASFGAVAEDGTAFARDFPGAVVFSFHATKAFGIGEGGLVYSGDSSLIEHIRQSGNFGFGPERASMTSGLNSKMSEYAAAIALATLDAFPQKAAERLRIHDWYTKALASSGAHLSGWESQQISGTTPHQFMPLLTPPGVDNNLAVRGAAARGVQLRTYFSPACHEQPHFSTSQRTELHTTNSLSSRILSLPLWEGMTLDHVFRVVDSVTAAQDERTTD